MITKKWPKFVSGLWKTEEVKEEAPKRTRRNFKGMDANGGHSGINVKVEDYKPGARGVYIRKDVYGALVEICEKEGVSLHSLMMYAISYFIRQYQKGKAPIEKTEVVILKKG
jgi:hypothetical protein